MGRLESVIGDKSETRVRSNTTTGRVGGSVGGFECGAGERKGLVGSSESKSVKDLDLDDASATHYDMVRNPGNRDDVSEFELEAAARVESNVNRGDARTVSTISRAEAATLQQRFAAVQLEKTHAKPEKEDLLTGLAMAPTGLQAGVRIAEGESCRPDTRKAVKDLGGIQVEMTPRAYLTRKAVLRRALDHNICRCGWTEDECITLMLTHLPMTLQANASKMHGLEEFFGFLDLQFLPEELDHELSEWNRTKIGTQSISEYYNNLDQMAKRLGKSPVEHALAFREGLREDRPSHRSVRPRDRTRTRFLCSASRALQRNPMGVFRLESAAA